MEATMFTGWVYDTLKPWAIELKVAHPPMLKAIAASRKERPGRCEKDRRSTAMRSTAGMLYRPTEVRELRRMLRYRNLVVTEAVRMKNRIAGLLMETGTEYNKQRLHGGRYFSELLANLEEVPESVMHLLKLSRASVEMFRSVERELRQRLLKDPLLRNRVELLQTIPGVGEILSLTWALEVGEIERFPSIGQAVSYCGLCSAEHSSAGLQHRGPISKKRNRHLQVVLIEAAKVAPRWAPRLMEIRDRERLRGSKNRASLAVARHLVAYLMSVDRSGQPFVAQDPKVA